MRRRIAESRASTIAETCEGNFFSMVFIYALCFEIEMLDMDMRIPNLWVAGWVTCAYLDPGTLPNKDPEARRGGPN